MKTVKYLLILIFCISAGSLQAEEMPESRELLSNIDLESLSALELEGQIFRYDEEHNGPVYTPESGDIDSVLQIHRQLEPEIMVEALYRLPYPDDFDLDSDDILSRIYELGHNVSTISGVKYYSVRKQGHAVLFTDVYQVNNLTDRKKIEDSIPSASSFGDTVYLHMKENALGSGYYRLDYRKNEKLVSMKLVNESVMGFIITAVSKEDMIINLQIIPCSDAILIYGYCGVVLQNDALVNLMLDPYYAFYRRMTAMETWLYNSLHGTDLLPELMSPRS